MISMQQPLREPVGDPVSMNTVMTIQQVDQKADEKQPISLLKLNMPVSSLTSMPAAQTLVWQTEAVEKIKEEADQQVDQFNDEEKHVEEDAKYEEDEDQFTDAPIKPTVVEGSDEDGSGLDEMESRKVADVDADLQQFQERIQQPLQSKQPVSQSSSTQPLLTLTTAPVGPFIYTHKTVIQPALPLSRNRRERKIWDPGIMLGKIFKQHLEDKVFLRAGVMI